MVAYEVKYNPCISFPIGQVSFLAASAAVAWKDWSERSRGQGRELQGTLTSFSLVHCHAWSQIYWWKILNVASWSWIYIHSWKTQAAATPWGIEHENVNACSYLLMSSEVLLLLHIVDKFAFASGCNDHSFLSHNTMTVLAAAAAETKSPNFAVPLLLLHALNSFSQHTLMHPDSWLISGNFLLLRMNRNDYQIYNSIYIQFYQQYE
jgi:hypothetical protein